MEVQLLVPNTTEIDDVAEFVANEPRPTPESRPWVVVNMVASIDGAIEIDGRSGGLGSASDREVFRALRAVADTILVGAGTARTENYGPPSVSDAARRRRLDSGQRAAPRLAVVTKSCDLDPSSRLFDNGHRPIVVTCHASAVPAEIDAVADVLRTGDGEVDLAAALVTLRADGDRVVLVEGGPSLNAALHDGALIDEWCVSISPKVVGAASTRIVHGGRQGSDLRLSRLMIGDDTLFTRYLTHP